MRFAAQHALLQGDENIVGPLGDYLERADGAGVVWALEVAGTLRDPRLTDAIDQHLTSPDAPRRAMATRSLAPSGTGLIRLGELLSDEDPAVRAAAVAATGNPGGEVLAGRIGRLLSDRAWIVRQQAGASLSSMGPTGAMVLRMHLSDPDPYARDMAQRALDDLEAKGGRAVSPAKIPRGLDTWHGEDTHGPAAPVQEQAA